MSGDHHCYSETRFTSVIASFHLDHAAALTYITEKVCAKVYFKDVSSHDHASQTNFRDGKGKVYMTHPTKALHKFMMQDYVRMGSASLLTVLSQH